MPITKSGKIICPIYRASGQTVIRPMQSVYAILISTSVGVFTRPWSSRSSNVGSEPGCGMNISVNKNDIMKMGKTEIINTWGKSKTLSTYIKSYKKCTRKVIYLLSDYKITTVFRFACYFGFSKFRLFYSIIK